MSPLLDRLLGFRPTEFTVVGVVPGNGDSLRRRAREAR